MALLPKSYTGQNWTPILLGGGRCGANCRRPMIFSIYRFYKGIVSNVSLYRNIEFKLRDKLCEKVINMKLLRFPLL